MSVADPLESNGSWPLQSWPRYIQSRPSLVDTIDWKRPLTFLPRTDAGLSTSGIWTQLSIGLLTAHRRKDPPNCGSLEWPYAGTGTWWHQRQYGETPPNPRMKVAASRVRYHMGGGGLPCKSPNPPQKNGQLSVNVFIFGRKLKILVLTQLSRVATLRLSA